MTPPVAAALRAALGSDGGSGRAVGLAVSGGGDSLALLSLVRPIAAELGVPLHAVTVDHGLRAEAAEEAALVARYCAQMGVRHAVLHWRGHEGGNLQDAARRARYRLIGDWAEARGIGRVLLAHTADDDAETFVMGLTRGAGLDGLTGMRESFERGGVRFLRPLLTVRRAELRAHLRQAGLIWAEDPSNADESFARVRARRALGVLEGLGVGPEMLGRTIANLRDTRAAIDAHLDEVARAHVVQDRGDLLFPLAPIQDLPADFRRRLLIRALRWVASRDYPPRAAKLRGLLEHLPRSLHGCLIRAEGGRVRITREYAALRGVESATNAVWDRRWRLTGPHEARLSIRALGPDGLALCPDWRGAGLPRASLLASPAIWAEERLIAAPLVRPEPEWSARIVADFHRPGDSH